MKRLIAAVLACTLLFSFITVCAADREEAYAETAQRLRGCPVPEVGSIGGEWLVIGLARANLLTPETAEAYYQNVVSYVTEKGSAKLDRNKATENARVILALTAIGRDPTDVGGYQLLAPLADFSFVKKQGVNGAIWTLLALDSLAYELPDAPEGKEQTTVPKLISHILGQQNESGAWGMGDNANDPDLTGMALQALAPYEACDENVRTAVGKALDYLSAHQREDGSFLSAQAPSPESCAQVIVALTALGIRPDEDSRFIKNGNSAVDCLLGFYGGGGFAHEANGDANQMSTEQAFYALTAVKRMEQGNTALYDMSDLLTPYDVNLDGKTDITDATLLQKYLAELAPLNRRQLKLAKADAYGRVTVTAVTEVQKYIASH